MRKIKNIFYCLGLTSFMLILMTSCGDRTKGGFDSDNTSSGNKTAQSEPVFNSSIKMDISEQISVDIPSVDVYDVEQEKIQVNPVSFNIQTMYKNIFPEDTSEQTLKNVDDGVEALTTRQGSQIIYDESGWCGGSTKMWDIYNDFLGFRVAEDIVVDTSVSGELDFMSREDAEGKIRSLIKHIGIDFEPGKIEIEAYTKEYFTELINALKITVFMQEILKKRRRNVSGRLLTRCII